MIALCIITAICGATAIGAAVALSSSLLAAAGGMTLLIAGYGLGSS